MRKLFLFLQKLDKDLINYLNLIDVVIQNQNLRIATGVLNEIMAEAVAMQQPPSDKGKRLRSILYYSSICKTTYFCYFC